jgi:hypothetical protein
MNYVGRIFVFTWRRHRRWCEIYCGSDLLTVRLLHVQIKVASFRLVSQIIPVDSILHFWLKNGLTGSTTNDIDMSPDIWNLNTLGFVIIVIINGLGSWEDTTSMLVVSLIKHHKTQLAEKCISHKSGDPTVPLTSCCTLSWPNTVLTIIFFVSKDRLRNVAFALAFQARRILQSATKCADPYTEPRGIDAVLQHTSHCKSSMVLELAGAKEKIIIFS